MTTIAFDGKVMACDSCWADREVQTVRRSKIQRFATGALYGGAGGFDDRELVELLKKVKKPEQLPSLADLAKIRQTLRALFVLPDGRAYIIDTCRVNAGESATRRRASRRLASTMRRALRRRLRRQVRAGGHEGHGRCLRGGPHRLRHRHQLEGAYLPPDAAPSAADEEQEETGMTAESETKPHSVCCAIDPSRSTVAPTYREAYLIWRHWQHKDANGKTDYDYEFKIHSLGRECSPGSPVVDVNE
jgi:hypothetical protein